MEKKKRKNLEKSSSIRTVLIQGWAPPLPQLDGASDISAGAPSTSTVDSFSFWVLALVCHAYPAFVRTPSSFSPKTLKSIRWLVFRFCFSEIEVKKGKKDRRTF